MTSAALPGVSLTFERAASDDEPLRTDVAVFLGRTRRGPVGEPVRVESWNDVVGAFGPPDGTSSTPYALRGFFENDGRTAWVLRVSGPAEPAHAVWTDDHVVVAASPGAWANGGRVTVRYQASSVAGPPAVTVRVLVPGEPAEIFAGMAPTEVVDRLTASRLVRLVPLGPAAPADPIPPDAPISMSWDLTLTGGTDSPPGRAEYASAAAAQAELPEPALVALPDLGTDLTGDDHTDLVLALLGVVAPLLDRLVLLDVPAERSTVDDVLDWVGTLADLGDEALLAAAAV
ncbi:MAG: phage tail protein, partial [Actinophytocola sp.]